MALQMDVPTDLDNNYLDRARQFLHEHSADIPLDQGAIIEKVFPESPNENESLRLDIIITTPEGVFIDNLM